MREIALSQGFIALVDDEDYEALARHRWHVQIQEGNGYAKRNLPRGGGRRASTITMHRQILGEPPMGMRIDHRNHRPLADRVVDNRRENLRFASPAQNAMNKGKFHGKSAFKGVSLHAFSGLWRATFSVERKHVNVGYFKHEVHAAYAYDLAIVRVRGPFAVTNFPVPGSEKWLYG